ncbi:hypothetical protein X769_28455 [Mesorhizobium sp. LSJC268A00]|nr:hypothetical protein X769_28455 [Mesorhizobium sp. LSJC268A00]
MIRKRSIPMLDDMAEYLIQRSSQHVMICSRIMHQLYDMKRDQLSCIWRRTMAPSKRTPDQRSEIIGTLNQAVRQLKSRPR